MKTRSTFDTGFFSELGRDVCYHVTPTVHRLKMTLDLKYVKNCYGLGQAERG